jgi:hypothetical protein
LLNASQFGFRGRHSTTLQCMRLADHVTLNFNNKMYTAAVFLEVPCVEAGKNTYTVFPASRKRRRNGNPVVSDETVMYGYESSATLTTDR